MEPVVVAFKIPENIGGVLRWFVEALRPLSGVRHRESQGVGLFLGEPSEQNPGDPDATRDIVIAAYRRREIPIPSSWADLIDGWKYETEPLGPVMQFRFFGRRGETHVWAVCAEHLSPVVLVFEDFLKQIEARYPVVGPLGREYETQRIERVKENLKTKFGGDVSQPMQRDEGPSGGASAAGALRRGRPTGGRWAVYGAEARIARTPEHPEKRKKKEVVRAMRQEGRTLEEIAEAVEISVSTVKRWLQEMSRK